MSVLNRLVLFVLSLSALGGGLYLAAAHPLAPGLSTFAFSSLVMFFIWRPRLALAALPAFLPVLNFAPWTGWSITDEFDLLVLAVVAAGYVRMLCLRSEPTPWVAWSLILAVSLVFLTLGNSGLALQDLDAYAGYTTPLNAFRVGKSVLWLVLLGPLLSSVNSNSSDCKTTSELLFACLLGSAWVVLAACWERGVYPGWFDFSTPYRTVALFWEMHLGGAALDAYLVLVAPLLVWAWHASLSPVLRISLGAYIQAYVYVCLTTYSRGVLGAIAGSMILLSALLLKRRGKVGQASPVFRRSSLCVLFLVTLEIVFVFGSDSFMNRRIADSERDFGHRLQHWGQGIGLFKTADDWLFGVGLGKLPSRWTHLEEGPVLSGDYFIHQNGDRRTMVLDGPEARIGDDKARRYGGLYSISQRVDLVSGQRYRFAMDVRGEPGTEMMVQVCAQHLLYPASCQARRIRLDTGSWLHWDSELAGYPFKASAWRRFGRGVFALSVLTPGARVEMTDLHLSAGGDNLLRNAQFREGSTAWFPIGRSYFLPWHIDNLYLEILIETGIVGLSVFLVLVFSVVRRLFHAYGRGQTLAAYFLSSIAGLMALGLLVSVLDMPRVATLFGLLLLGGWQCAIRDQKHSCAPERTP